MASEKLLESKLRDMVKRLGGLAIKFFCQTFTGLPDRIILMPGGRIYFAEIKTTGKKPTVRQLFVHAMLIRMGFTVWVIDTPETLKAALDKIQLDQLL